MKHTTSSLDHFMEQAKKHPLLTSDEEIHLARSVQAMIALRQANPSGPYSRKEEGILRRGTRARERFTTANIRLVVSVAGKYHRRLQGAIDMAEADLVQEGMLGLMRAVDKFDPERGYKFSTYAYWWIRQSIGRGLKDLGRPIRLPVHVHDKWYSLRATRQELTAKLGRMPTGPELAEAMGWTAELLSQVLRAGARPVSLDAVYGEGDASLAEFVADESSLPDQLDAIDEQDDAVRVRAALAKLPPKQREVLEMRFGLGIRREPATLGAIARQLGCHRENVRQRATSGMRRMAAELRRSA